MILEPIDVAFEEEVMHLAGERRKRESSADYLRRIARIRALLRQEAAARTIAADAIQAEADQLRELALTADRHGEGQIWNAHRVWTWLSDRAEVIRGGAA